VARRGPKFSFRDSPGRPGRPKIDPLPPYLDSRAAGPTHTLMADFTQGLDASKLILAETVRFYL
jgi:hypothetical protein